MLVFILIIASIFYGLNMGSDARNPLSLIIAGYLMQRYLPKWVKAWVDKL